jgi:hypothetical protein
VLCGGAAVGMGVGVVMQVGWARGALLVRTVSLWGIVGYGGSPKIAGTRLRTVISLSGYEHPNVFLSFIFLAP